MNAVMNAATKNQQLAPHSQQQLALMLGAIPGAEGGDVVVRASVKALRRAARKTVQPHKK